MLTVITVMVKEFVDGESGAILLLIGDVPELDENVDEDKGDEDTDCLV